MADVQSLNGSDKDGCIKGSYKNSLRQLGLLVERSDVKRIGFLLIVAAFLCLVVYNGESSIQPLPQLFSLTTFVSMSIPTKPDPNNTHTTISNDVRTLEEILSEASMEEKTVIITTLNRAWAEPNSTFDLFLESFHIGKGTKRLLRHLVVVCMDEEAHFRCLEVHPRRCYLLKTAGIDFSGQKNYMTPDYLKMMWRRLEFLGSILKLGYNFLLTDMDIMWLRDPFPHLFPEGDFQIACDEYNGNWSDPKNFVNAGFKLVQANNRTVEFYKYWHESRQRFRGHGTQVVFNNIKHERYVTETLGLTMRFLSTLYFRGFCQMSGEMDKICTMHANCCISLQNKVMDLRRVLQDWKAYLSTTDGRNITWRWPDNCLGRVEKGLI